MHSSKIWYMGNRCFFSLDITDSMLTQYSPTFVKGGIKSALTVYHVREALNLTLMQATHCKDMFKQARKGFRPISASQIFLGSL